MAAKDSSVRPEQVPTFEEFSFEEKMYRESVWKEQQAQPLSTTTEEPAFRGWLEGKPNPVLPEYEARFPKEDLRSESGTRLADMFPGTIGTIHPIPDGSQITSPRRQSYFDKAAAYPKADRGNTERIPVGCWLTLLWRRTFGGSAILLADDVPVAAFTTNVPHTVEEVVMLR